MKTLELKMNADASEAAEAVYTTDEFARLLRCSSRTVRRMISEGKLRKLPLGRLVRIPASEFGRLAEEGYL